MCKFLQPQRGIRLTKFYGSRKRCPVNDESSGLDTSSDDDFLVRNDIVIPPTPDSEVVSDNLDTSGTLKSR